MSNNPRKRAALKGYGLEIVDIVPIETVPNIHNEKYLQTKAAHDRKFRQMYDLLEAWLQKTEPIAAGASTFPPNVNFPPVTNSSTLTGTEENNIKSNPSQQKPLSNSAGQRLLP